MGALKDKVAIITGASSGIGHATAKLFARAGARLVVAARGPAKLGALAFCCCRSCPAGDGIPGSCRSHAVSRGVG